MRKRTFLLLLLISGLAYGQIYTWHDANGVVHYSDVPPAGTVGVHKIRPETGNPAETQRARRALAEQELQFKEQRQAAAKAAAQAAKKRAAEAIRKQNCEQARSYLRTLQSGERISQIDDKGQRVYLSDRARSRQIAATQRSIASWCR